LGHLHLRVTDLERSEAFYREKLGVEVMQRSFPGARFLGADGYHHHLGLNTWGGPRSPQPPGALGLAEATFARAGTTAESMFVDPDGIHLRLQPALVPA
jgi:catechol 2,3-dioxygenase